MKKLSVVIAFMLVLCSCAKAPEEPEVPEVNEEPAQEIVEETPEPEPEPVMTEEEINALSNDSFGWGFVKKPGAPSEFTKGQRDMMEKYSCIYEGSAEGKPLYLTFDEGYENGYTAVILDTLKEKGVTAAFFVTGPYIDGNADLIRRMLDEGHIVGNHTVRHPNMPSLGTAEAMENEINELDLKFYEAFGEHLTYFRPPEGAYSERSLAATNAAGCKTVLWSFAYRDWERDNQKGAGYAKDSVIPYLYGGSVLLLHAVSSDNASALGDIIDSAREQGFTFRSLDEFK